MSINSLNNAPLRSNASLSLQSWRLAQTVTPCAVRGAPKPCRCDPSCRRPAVTSGPSPPAPDTVCQPGHGHEAKPPRARPAQILTRPAAGPRTVPETRSSRTKIAARLAYSQNRGCAPPGRHSSVKLRSFPFSEEGHGDNNAIDVRSFQNESVLGCITTKAWKKLMQRLSRLCRARVSALSRPGRVWFYLEHGRLRPPGCSCPDENINTNGLGRPRTPPLGEQSATGWLPGCPGSATASRLLKDSQSGGRLSRIPGALCDGD